MRTTIVYIFITATRDKLFLGLLAGILAVAALSAMLGGTSLAENTQMSVVFTAAASRVLLILGMIVFICFHLRQEFDNKEIDLLLSRPISRIRVVFAYWCSFALVSVMMALPVMAIVAVYDVADMDGYMLWAASIMLELLIISAISVFCGFMLKSAVSSVLSCMGFYVLSRMSGLFVVTAESRTLFQDYMVGNGIEYVMKAISAIMPRLDMFSNSEWLVYGAGRTDIFWLCLVQAVVYVSVLLTAAIMDFRRREF